MNEVSGIERVPSGVPGLDTVLRGGFPRGGIHMDTSRNPTGWRVIADRQGKWRRRRLAMA